MATKAKPTQGARARRKTAEKQERGKMLSFMSRQSLLEAQGPPVVPVLLDVAGEMVLIRRVHLPTLARNGAIPKPLTAAIRKLTEYGVNGAQDRMEPDTYLETCVALARAAVVVPPAEMMDALEQANDVLSELPEDDSVMDEARQLTALQSALESMAPEADESGRRLTRKLARAAQQRLANDERLKEVREIRDKAFKIIEDAARGVDPDDLRPLFVATDQKPGEDQLVLVEDPTDTGDADPALCVSLHRADLNALTRAIYVNGPGAFARFRR